MPIYDIKYDGIVCETFSHCLFRTFDFPQDDWERLGFQEPSINEDAHATPATPATPATTVLSDTPTNTLPRSAANMCKEKVRPRVSSAPAAIDVNVSKTGFLAKIMAKKAQRRKGMLFALFPHFGVCIRNIAN